MKSVAANGASIPIIGLGTTQLKGGDCVAMVEQAIGIGYRLIDTAQMYENEREVGEGVRASGKRGEVTVVTKLLPTNLAPRDVERTAKESLSKLGLSEVDVLLIHWPNPKIPLADTLGAMAKLRDAGLTKQIGVSNFTVALIGEAVKASPAPIVCNQVECHPYLDQSKVRAACREQGIAVTAYSPIARGRAGGDELLEKIGKAHGKGAAQVCLRWLVQQDIIVIPRTSKAARLKENFAIFDFELSAAEMKNIAGLAKPSGRILDWSWSPEWD
jgi:diketogulonate reductase-like aldo/keto reductase